jgi:hypothetical protein
MQNQEVYQSGEDIDFDLLNDQLQKKALIETSPDQVNVHSKEPWKSYNIGR